MNNPKAKLYFVDGDGKKYPNSTPMPLSEIAEIKRGNGLSKSAIVSDGKYLCILYGQLFSLYGTKIEKVLSATNTQTSVLSKKGDILMPTSDVTSSGLATASSLLVNDVLLGGDMNIIRPSNIVNSIFLAYYIRHNKKPIMDSVTGSTVKHIYPKDLAKIVYRIPSLPEQEKIAEFLSALDDRIDLQSKKIDLLIEQKKGYSQKIFSREFVFKDDNGNSYGEWNNAPLSNLIVIGKSGGTPSSTNSSYYHGPIPFLSIADMSNQGKYISRTEKTLTQEGLDSSSAWVVPRHSLIYAMYASVGKVAFNTVEMATSQALFAMQLDEKQVHSEYVYQYLAFFKTNGLDAHITTGTQGNINASTLKSFNIPLPTLKEQTKIIGLLSALDKSLTLEQQKIELLKEQKQGYMQRIFE